MQPPVITDRWSMPLTCTHLLAPVRYYELGFILNPCVLSLFLHYYRRVRLVKTYSYCISWCPLIMNWRQCLWHFNRNKGRNGIEFFFKFDTLCDSPFYPELNNVESISSKFTSFLRNGTFPQVEERTGHFVARFFIPNLAMLKVFPPSLLPF